MAEQNKRIRVLFTIPNFDTAGSGKALLNIATRLDANRFDVHIMCMHDRGDFFQVVKQSGIPIHLLQYTTPMKPYWKGLWNCWQISRHLRKIKPDIIHSFHYSADYSEALAATMAGIKWIYTKKNMMWAGSSANAWKLRTQLANGIITINSEMNTIFFNGKKKVVTIHRGIYRTDFAQDGKTQIPFHNYFSSEVCRFLICIANLTPVKGVEYLIAAWAQLCKEFPSWGLLIVGDDKNAYADTLKDQVNREGTVGRVWFTGRQLSVKPFLDAAEIVVMPTCSKGEGFGVVLIEAMANGKVILASDVPGIRDQLEVFPESLFKAEDVAMLKQKLEYLLNLSASELSKMGEQFKQHCTENFDIGIEVDKHERVYTALHSGNKDMSGLFYEREA